MLTVKNKMNEHEEKLYITRNSRSYFCGKAGKGPAQMKCREDRYLCVESPTIVFWSPILQQPAESRQNIENYSRGPGRNPKNGHCLISALYLKGDVSYI
jgi:hypothetical protein